MRKDELKEDILRQYIDPENIRKAPEGFSSKVMSHIYLEAKPVRAENKVIIPVISVAVFLILTTAALFVTESSLTLPELNWPVDFNFSFPDISSKIRVPQIVLYLIGGIALITILDSVLISVFRREKS